MRLAAVVVVVAACGSSHGGSSSDAPPPLDAISADAGLPAPIAPGDFAQPLDKAFIRGLQTWIDDATFEVKWTAALATPIAFLGSTDSAFHADLARRAVALPGGEVICHGDAKLDNFGWIHVADTSVFSDVDFDDAGPCPAAADILHFLVATDLQFGSSVLDEAALSSYIATVTSPDTIVAIDPATVPTWDTLQSNGVDKDTHGTAIALGGEVQAATADERTAVTALVTADTRFPRTLLDIARDVKTDGGSAGLRRFWVLVEDAQHPRTIIELKELAKPGTELGPHTTTLDGPDRFDTLKPFWWNAAAPGDHFAVDLLGGHFVARDRYRRVSAKPTTLSAQQNALAAETSLMALRHRAAWAGSDPAALRTWLRESAATVTARWRAAYTAAGGH